MTHWQRWISHPQTLWLRKAIFQIHLWSGVGIGLYVLVVSVTGSIVVYRNELYTATTRPPIIVTRTGPRLTDEQLRAAAVRLHPGSRVVGIGARENPDEAVTVSLDGFGDSEHRLFNPYTGEDLGDSESFGFWVVSKLLQLHDDLLAGDTGRSVNGIGALLVIVLALTGLVAWWPGIRTWRRSLMVHRNVGWRRFTWDLHSMIGFWTLAFILLFAVSGVYLSFPQAVQEILDRIQPLTNANAESRFVDQFAYWLAYLHVGRVNGIGLPCHGPGLCDQTTKFVWALFGLAPATLFVTGAIMWWNRVVRKKPRRTVPQK
jgi:uncharacterized iron-regulated membrane protein